MPLMETCTDHVKGEDFFTMTAAETWSIAMVKRLKAKYPEDVEIRHTNPDGSMIARMPFAWMRVVPKKKDTLTDEERQARREWGRQARMSQLGAQPPATAPNSDEQPPPHAGDTPSMKKAPCISAGQAGCKRPTQNPQGTR